jgi:hypothetical protein
VAGRLTMPVPAQPAVVPAAEQPSIGRSSVVTGLVLDGTRYTSAPVAAQPQTRQYLLGGHGELVAGVSNAQAASLALMVAGRLTMPVPAQPVAADMPYQKARQLRQLIDGQSRRSSQPVAVPASPALIGTGSAYDGR